LEFYIVHVQDFAEIIVEQAEEVENRIVNAIGQETFTYKELIKNIMQIIGKKKPVICVSPFLGYIAGRIIGIIKKDVTITRPEIKGLMQNLLYVDDLPKGKIKLTEWATENKNSLGIKYASELERR